MEDVNIRKSKAYHSAVSEGRVDEYGNPIRRENMSSEWLSAHPNPEYDAASAAGFLDDYGNILPGAPAPLPAAAPAASTPPPRRNIIEDPVTEDSTPWTPASTIPTGTYVDGRYVPAPRYNENAEDIDFDDIPWQTTPSPPPTPPPPPPSGPKPRPKHGIHNVSGGSSI